MVFIDYMDNKIAEKDLASFLSELKNTRSRLISDHLAFEYASSMVIISIAANN